MWLTLSYANGADFIFGLRGTLNFILAVEANRWRTRVGEIESYQEAPRRRSFERTFYFKRGPLGNRIRPPVRESRRRGRRPGALGSRALTPTPARSVRATVIHNPQSALSLA